MPQDQAIAAAKAQFQSVFGTAPAVTAYAPGRVNLLGEHTDYNGGYVFPMPLALGTAVALAPGSEPGTLEATSAAFDGTTKRSFDEAPSDHWTDYIVGPLLELFAGKAPPTGLRIAVASSLPVGSGLSSSAALEIATLRAVTAQFDIAKTPVALALLARAGENNYVGVPCGIMDQYSVSVGSPGTAVFLDTAKLASKVVDLPTSHNFVVVHSGVSHNLGEDGYETRVAECTAACKALGVETLSDLGLEDVGKIEALEEPLNGRARHIVTENARVLAAIEALGEGDLAHFGNLMTESHASQRDDYAVSVPQVDALVEGAIAAGADGARLTGGGFGGSIVAFVEKPGLDAWRISVESAHPKATVLCVT